MMSQRYGLTYPSKSGGKAVFRKSSQGSIILRTTDTDTEEWDSEADKIYQSPPQWSRKRSYITRLQKQNKRRFFKTSQNTKCSKNVPAHAYKHSEAKTDNRYSCEEEKPVNGKPSSKNTYCIWAKMDKHKLECPSTSKISVLSKGSFEKKSNSDWKMIQRKHLMNKFDRFTRGILKMTGKLSTETVDMITTRIRDNLERKDERFTQRVTKECSKKKTVSFIKKILQGASAKIAEHHRKKPQKKYNLARQSMSPSIKAKSEILPKLLNLKYCGSKSVVKTRCMQTSTRTLYRSQSELLVKSTCNIKILRSLSETSNTILTKPFKHSNLKLAKEVSNKCEPDPSQVCTWSNDPMVMRTLGILKDASSKKIISVTQDESSNDGSDNNISGNISSSCTVVAKDNSRKKIINEGSSSASSIIPDIYANASSSSTVMMSVKLRNMYDKYRRNID